MFLSKWSAPIAVGLFLLGITLVLQWRSYATVPVPDNPTRVSATTIKRLEEEQRILKDQIEQIQKELRVYQELALFRQDTLKGLGEELEKQRVIAGLVPLKGPGIKAIVDDSTRNPLPTEDPNLYIVHDYQVRDVVNLLWQEKAEAIAINNERLVGTSSIYSSGGVIMVNNTRLSPPYEVSAVGNSDRLFGALSNPSYLRSLKSQVATYNLQFRFQKAPEVTLPAFKAGYTIRNASINE